MLATVLANLEIPFSITIIITSELVSESNPPGIIITSGSDAWFLRHACHTVCHGVAMLLSSMLVHFATLSLARQCEIQGSCCYVYIARKVSLRR